MTCVRMFFVLCVACLVVFFLFSLEQKGVMFVVITCIRHTHIYIVIYIHEYDQAVDEVYRR